MTVDTIQPNRHPDSQTSSTRQRRSLIHPVVDFLGLGGASIILLPIIAFFLEPVKWEASLAAWMLILANLINHPHFAHSYQIFYRGFRDKAFGEAYSPALRRRYQFAGIVAPTMLLTFMATGFIAKNPTWLGYGYNIMAFLVGWHYVKQGYGMLIVDSVLQKRFFSDKEKSLFRANGYACWLVTWIGLNRTVAEHDFFQLKYYTIDLPDPLFFLVAAITLATTLVTFWTFFQKTRSGAGVPINGVVAYLVSLYLWLVFVHVNPLFILVVPAFHSLQYLLVVWRFQLNVEQAKPDAQEKLEPIYGGNFLPEKSASRFGIFILTGVILGVVGFFIVPMALDRAVSYDPILGTTAFVFMFWIFINVHHYCLDNVMWRREKPETGKHLFSHE